ncbi:phosphatidylglycerol lysyltransferase domain-containing protein [Chitinophaga nivalis]|uniref:Phosphatidylglycerol lysyltransferase n=1 Tax=Chitinophaga nivalis TaxID=2991709 RepID=A0ABT3IEE0_9BACT|nr:phosphatidylglycerol lysyltransferase domain-containing protein [Chitinophaga nivalis]MCW3467985.1 phosphatidylglycerol lysyltransferase domain-containing protein [Chitinophaga nivalis]MCW3482324.1 phosphatidylglycerol lysyltransferase domain-containing protein [Chitinophaga nivalis]
MGKKFLTVAFLRKLHLKELLAVLFILLAIYFFRSQRHELYALIPAIKKADRGWVLSGIVITFAYILLQALMYVFSFRSVGARLDTLKSTELFLKRNLLSVFLPAGGISSLAYLPQSLRRTSLHKQQIHQASGIYGFTGILSVFLAGIPVVLYAMLHTGSMKDAIWGLTAICLLLLGVVWLVRSMQSKGKAYQLLAKYFPAAAAQADEIFAFHLSVPAFMNTVVASVLIEVAGVAHLYLSMLAAGVAPSLEAACVGYIVATIFLIISPFLRGLGAIELSLAYLLSNYGYSTLEALEITLLFRLFEFWLPLVAGMIAFALKGKELVLRLLPPILIFLLGMVNIFSVLTPPLANRVHLLRAYIPGTSIHATNLLVVFLGLILLVTATFLFKGLRSAWIVALTVSGLSAIGHISKALDYEEATLAVITSVILLITARQYRVKSNPQLVNIGVVTAMATFVVVLIFGAIGFYFLNVRHFGLDFTWLQSLRHAFHCFMLLEDDGLRPVTRFAREFMSAIRALGVGAWAFLFYTIIRPYLQVARHSNVALEKAHFYLSQYGDSPMDYFKVGQDKLLFVSSQYEGFIAYRVASSFAIVLEEPVCSEDHKMLLLEEFEAQCKKMGLRPAFYRVDEDSTYYFSRLKKKKMLIGQEAIMDIRDFTLSGKDKKSLRNGLNSLANKGYVTTFHPAPQTPDMIAELRAVSDEWLQQYEVKELTFSQGLFDAVAMQQQDMITVTDAEGKVAAFLNIIPDYAPGECTYDLIRKRSDAPGGVMDALIIHLIQHAQAKELQYLNLGMVPMSGISQPQNTAEKMVKYAYEKLRFFRHYQGLREFKAKYATTWTNKYLVYEHDFDLIQLPGALSKVMQP